MIRIEVIQGDNKIETVYVDQNALNVYNVIINYEKRWCDYTTGSCSGGIDVEKYQSFYLYDVDHDFAGEPFTAHGNAISEVKIFHDGELDNLYQVVTQEKDQLHVLFLPMLMVDDGVMLASWESPEWRAEMESVNRRMNPMDENGELFEI